MELAVVERRQVGERTSMTLEGGGQTRTISVPTVTRFRAVARDLDSETEGGKITGYAAVFDELSDDLGGFREQLKRGAFRRSLKRTDDLDVRMLYNHDPNYVLARSTNDTLTLKEDPKGLQIEATLADTSYARDLQTLMARGDVDQMSFGFTVSGDEWEEREDGSVIRTVTEIDQLFDVSVVTYPAYPQTSADLRLTSPAEDTGELTDGTAPTAGQEDDERKASRSEQVARAQRLVTLARAKLTI